VLALQAKCVDAPPGSADDVRVATGKDDVADALEGWRGPSSDISFEPDDFEILDLTLCLMPELRICAQAVKIARAAGIRYPINSPDEIVDLVNENSGAAWGGYEFSRAGASLFLSPEHFPIEHEGELISRVFLTHMRVRYEEGLATAARLREPGERPSVPGREDS
jgi:hypothetical protein